MVIIDLHREYKEEIVPDMVGHRSGSPRIVEVAS